MTTAGLLCVSRGTDLSEKAKFCSQCGAAVSSAPRPAEYKQVTVLFADVVHSMDIAVRRSPMIYKVIAAASIATSTCAFTPAVAPVSAADEYTDADTEFLAAVTPWVGPGAGPVTKQLMNELIADGHKVCNLLDTGQGDVRAVHREVVRR